MLYTEAMRVALYGKGKLGHRTYNYLSSAVGIELVCVCEDAESFGDGRELIFAEKTTIPDVVTVIDYPQMSRLCRDHEVDAIILATDNGLLDYTVRRLHRDGVSNIAIVPYYYEDADAIADDSFMWVDTDKPRMPYLEYHISFQCNLKCAGCTHFSNIYPGERFGSYTEYCSDLMRLQELFWGIGKIRLMGGEPLLNPDLPKFIYATREAFPDSDIRVVSNGLLLRPDHADVLSAMRETSTYFDISMYPPTVGSINRISDICKKYSVKLTVTPEITEFNAGMNLHGQSDPALSYAACPANHCAYLCNGKMSTCAMPQLLDIFNNRYGTCINAGDRDITDIYEEGLDGYELLRRLKLPMDICRFCDENRRSYPWFVSAEPIAAEWIGDTKTDGLMGANS